MGLAPLMTLCKVSVLLNIQPVVDFSFELATVLGVTIITLGLVTPKVSKINLSLAINNMIIQFQIVVVLTKYICRSSKKRVPFITFDKETNKKIDLLLHIVIAGIACTPILFGLPILGYGVVAE